MKNNFNTWYDIKDLNIDKLIDLIVTGNNINSIKPDSTIINYLGNTNTKLKILDFGCGIGRNSYAIAKHSNNWDVVGYDNENMLSRRIEFQKKYYDFELKNLSFSFDWDHIKHQKFDIIICILVLQHIYEDALTEYISDFKKMTNKLIINSRRFNDEMINNNYKNTFEILEKNGLYPENTKNIKNLKYSTYGDMDDHFICVYDNIKSK